MGLGIGWGLISPVWTPLLHQAEKKLQRMFARVRKHLGASSLAFKVWTLIQDQLVMR